MAAPRLDGVSFRPDESSSVPLYQQLTAALRAAIRGGRIRVGDRLPSEREYAARLGLSRTTVTAAYQELKDLGLLRGYVGRGAVVLASDTDQASVGAVPWSQMGARFTLLARSSSGGRAPGDIQLGDGWLHPSLMPREALAASAARIAGRPENVLVPAPALGLPALRAALAEQLGSQGGKLTPDEVLVTGGAQHGINVVARALLGPGDVVLCESPTWHGAFRAFRATGAQVVGIPMDHQGVDPDALEDALVRQRPKLVYLIPTIQCPTGRVMGLERRRRVLQLCERFRTPILESHVYGDLAFGSVPPSLKKLDNAGLVLQQGSASKTVTGALRVGWLAAPREAMALLGAAKANLDLTSPVMSQAVFANLLESGAYARHLTRLRTQLAARSEKLLDALSRHCPDLSCSRPPGGLYLWANLPRTVSGTEFEAAAAAEGVCVRGGEPFLPELGPSGQVRLCYAAPDVDELSIGAERLGVALRKLLSRPQRAPDHSMDGAWV